MRGLTRKEVYQVVHIGGVALVAALETLLSYPAPITWRTYVSMLIAALGAGGLYWAPPPGAHLPPIEPVQPEPLPEEQP